MPKNETADLIDLVIARAPQLRGVGVLELAHEGLSFKLRSLEPDVDPEPAAPEESENVWTDPATYGRGGVPGLTRKESK